VKSLRRVRFGGVELANLESGKLRALSAAEVESLRNAVRLAKNR
jgi:16S rRNA U516 pseudouridylate synthase RsuA-like enzyme